MLIPELFDPDDPSAREREKLDEYIATGRCASDKKQASDKPQVFFPCPELDPAIARNRKRAKYYLQKLLLACSEYNLDGKTVGELSGFIKDWQKVHGQMTFMVAVSLGTPILDDKTYVDLRCVEPYMVDAWNELAQQYRMKPTTQYKVQDAFRLVDSARFHKENVAQIQSTHRQTVDQSKTRYSPIVIAAILVAFALLVAAYIMRPTQPRYKVLGTDRVLDSETGEVLFGYPNRK